MIAYSVQDGNKHRIQFGNLALKEIIMHKYLRNFNFQNSFNKVHILEGFTKIFSESAIGKIAQIKVQ